MVRIEAVELYRLDLRTRLPFRYGLAEMTAVPHVFLRLHARFGQKAAAGLAADHLPPRWFEKNPDQPLDQEVANLLSGIRQAARQAIGADAPSVFDWWRQAYDAQLLWAASKQLPPLAAHFGVTLVERALIQAAACASRTPFHELLLQGGLGFEPARIHPELKGETWQRHFSHQPLSSVHVRHTVGLGDRVCSCDSSSAPRIDDGLPESLEEAIDAYGLRHFKIKLAGDAEADFDRLEELDRCLNRQSPNGFVFSLDGNEQYGSVAGFSEAWEQLARSSLLRNPGGQLLCIEQPVRRSRALEAAAAGVGDLPLRPPVIIDESDGALEDLPRALDLGYAGTSHKNCKGIFKGLAHRCLLDSRRQRAGGSKKFLLTGEDLSNIGPIALLQDLTVQATLGVTSVERNGHHYFRGLSMFPEEINDRMIAEFPGLYHRHPRGFAALNIQDGQLDLRALLGKPLGSIPDIPVHAFADSLSLQ